MTEVRWFLSIQFSKSLSRGGLFNLGHSGLGVKHFLLLDPAFRALPDVTGSATIRKVDPAVNPQIRCFPKNLGNPRKTSKNREKPIGRASARRRRLRPKEKEGGRVPRQGRHVLDGTPDRMEGASLRGPETLPPWNQVFKWSDTRRYHSGVRKLLHLALSIWCEPHRETIPHLRGFDQ